MDRLQYTHILQFMTLYIHKVICKYMNLVLEINKLTSLSGICIFCFAVFAINIVVNVEISRNFLCLYRRGKWHASQVINNLGAIMKNSLIRQVPTWLRLTCTYMMWSRYSRVLWLVMLLDGTSNLYSGP